MSDKREQLLAVVESDLQQDVSDFLALRGLMQELYGCLLQRDTPQIDLFNQQVSALLELIGQRSQRRGKVLLAFNLQLDEEGMASLLDSYPPVRRTRVQQLWGQLEQLIEQCKRLNERNGGLLAMHNDILNQLLASEGDAGLYGQSGY